MVNELGVHLGPGPYEWSKLGVRSKNNLYKLTTSQGVFVVKAFADSLRGRQGAEAEFRGSQALLDYGFRGTARRLARIENAVIMEHLPEAEPLAGSDAYLFLRQFLQQTKGLSAGWRVSDDSGCKEEYLRHLRGRMENLSLDGELRNSLNRLYAHLQGEAEFTEAQRVFVLSDFHPGQLVRSKGKTYLLDLEHSGMGDPRRFLCNLLLHPQGSLKTSEFQLLQQDLNLSEAAVSRVFPFSYVEWVLIVLNGYSLDRPMNLDSTELSQRRTKGEHLIRQALVWIKAGLPWLSRYLQEREQN